MFARLRSQRGANLLVELVMIVVGINIALWFEAWFDDLDDAETEQQYLLGLREDLLVDRKNLGETIAAAENELDKLGAILPVLSGPTAIPQEKLVEMAFEPSGYFFFEPSDFTYRSMQDSGDFRLLSDAGIKTGLLRLARQYRGIAMLQQNFLQALDDEYIPLMMRSFDILELRLTDPAILESQLFRNFFVYTYQDTEGRLKAYRQAEEQVQALLARMESRIES